MLSVDSQDKTRVYCSTVQKIKMAAKAPVPPSVQKSS